MDLSVRVDGRGFLVEGLLVGQLGVARLLAWVG